MPRRLLALALILLTATAHGQTKHKKAAPKGNSFTGILEANFPKWDLNHDGKLAADEVNRLIAERSITGDAAAALASIHVYMRDKKNAPPLTAAMLAHQAGKDGRSERRDQAAKLPHFEDNYQSFRGHLAKAPRELFVGSAPSLAGFSQGNLGDCYFLSAVGAAVARNPAAVKRMFQPHPDGSCELIFANGRRVHVGRLTDAEIALGSSAGEQGLWLNVLEKGFGLLKIHTSRNAHRGGETSLDAIASGGDADDTIELLTGHKADYLPIRRGKGKHLPPPNEAQVPMLMGKLRQAFRVTNAVHPLVCCGTSSGKLPPGVIDDHDYAILGFNTSTDSVLVWNPWGNHHQPKGPPGLQNGYVVEGGRFSVPLHDFVRIFEGVYYETALPPQKKHRK